MNGGDGMAKETMKVKIERLEQEKQADFKRIDALNKEIIEMQEKADQEFGNSPWKKQLEDQIDFQNSKITTLEGRLKQQISKNDALIDGIEERDQEIRFLKEKISQLESQGVQKVHNERKAGRKPKIDENTAILIQMYRAQSKTIKEIAKILNLSAGSVHKYCKPIGFLNSKIK